MRKTTSQEYPAKLFFRYEGETEAFPNKQNLGISQDLHYKKCLKERFFLKQKDESI